jgi:hypothetical protein
MDNLSQEYSPVKHIEASKDEASIEELTLSNQKLHNTQSFQKGSKRQVSITRPTFPQSSEKKQATHSPDYDTLETTRKNAPNNNIE